jgi:hypothetical protein
MPYSRTVKSPPGSSMRLELLVNVNEKCSFGRQGNAGVARVGQLRQQERKVDAQGVHVVSPTTDLALAEA